MRSAERELAELERKKSEGGSNGNGVGAAKKATPQEVLRQRALEISKQVAEETRRLAATRQQLQRLKANEGGGAAQSNNGSGAEKKTAEK
ncbi:MAG: hypothetical protein EOP84_05925, partial [Verrucomicrobiaceae bacterium]